jgi:hypothetical protein
MTPGTPRTPRKIHFLALALEIAKRLDGTGRLTGATRIGRIAQP